jgi:hypothetical protein
MVRGSMCLLVMLYFLICEKAVYYKHTLIIRIHSGPIRITNWQGAQYEIIVRFRETLFWRDGRVASQMSRFPNSLERSEMILGFLNNLTTRNTNTDRLDTRCE